LQSRYNFILLERKQNMTLNHKYLLLALVLSLAILLGACGPANTNASIIATGVAATVQAQNTQLAAVPPTLPPVVTPNLAPLGSATPVVTVAPPTAPTGLGSNQCTASATFKGETIPDGTIMSPGQAFLKTWHIQNSGTCTWDSTWKWVYSSGDLMGAAIVYPFPGVAVPGQTADVGITLVAPATNGTYTGYWKLQSRWGTVFTDVSGNAYSVRIVVGNATPANNKTPSMYGITAVTYDEPVRRCTSANTFWNVTAHVSSNGPTEAVFTWLQSDGNSHRRIGLTFTEATTLDLTSPTWSQGIASSTNPRWVQLIETAPTYQEFAKSLPLILCGH
jgi:hypothetical protein